MTCYKHYAFHVRSFLLVSTLAVLLSVVAGRAGAATVTFHFDRGSPSPPGYELAYIQDSYVVSFVIDRSFNPAGMVQLVDDFRASPCAGDGNLRLSAGSGNQSMEVAATMSFFRADRSPTDVIDITLCACQYSGSDPVTTPLAFVAFDDAGNEVASYLVEPNPTWPLAFIQAHLASPTGIHSVRIVGHVNTSIFDELTVQPADIVVPVQPRTWGSLKTIYR
jgi:hypothetical protein